MAGHNGLMVAFRPAPVLAVAAAVWVVWRVVLRRRRRPVLLHELAAVALLGWTLAMVSVTLFPLRIVFYDWHGRFSLVPFASTLQLLTETAPQVALRNLLGNVVMFVPLGLLLPVLFPRLRRPGALALRALAVSAAIETTQLLSRARAVDVDDLLLNVTGALVGWGFWWVLDRLVDGTRLAALLGRAASPDEREPLRTAAVPVLATAALVVPWMVGTIVAATVGDGPDGIEQVAVGDLADGAVVARTQIGDDTFLVASDLSPTGQRLRLTGFNHVLPGRYSLESWGETPAETGSSYRYGITPFNVDRGERPTFYLWGVNDVGATAVVVVGNGLDVVLPLPPTDHFIVGVEFAPDLSDVLADFDVRFVDAHGRDLSASVPLRTT